jgi:ribonuclease D
MTFQPTIDNDSVAALPAARFPGRIVIVDKEEQVEAACEELSRHRIIGFDTETRPSFRAGVSYNVALLQLSTEDTCFLFRLSHIRLSNRILKILGSRQILKIGADVTGDIRSLHALRSFHADGFVDLQREASRWNIEEKSLRKLSAIVLGERVSKAQRLSNWEAETLTEQQREYAATDAWVCIKILSALERSGKVEGELTIISAMPPMAEALEHKHKHTRRRHRKTENKHSKYDEREVKHNTPSQR